MGAGAGATPAAARADHAAAKLAWAPQLPTLVAMFASILGYAMVLPLLPQLLDADSLGPTLYGAVNSLGNFVALIAATWLGRLSDTHGRRPALLACASAGALGTVLLGMRLVLPAAAASTAQLLAVLGVIMRRVDRNSAGALLQGAVSIGFHCFATVLRPIWVYSTHSRGCRHHT